MRPTVSWSELRGTRVGVWGARVEGAANLRKLASIDVAPDVVVDDHVAGPVEGHPVVTLSNGGLEQLLACDVVVKSPGISRYRPEVAALSAAGVALTGGLALWLEEADLDRVIAVTGSKGKSTTTSIAGHLAAGLGRRPFVGGNLGHPPWDPKAAASPRAGSARPGEPDLWVLEVSSFQAADVAASPPVVAVTSLSPDHLDWHGDVETYYHDKLSLASQPGARVTVANGDDPVLRSHAGLLGPSVRWVTLEPGPPAVSSVGVASAAGAEVAGAEVAGAEVGGGEVGDRSRGVVAGSWAAGLGLLGDHNRRNALIAAAALDAAGVVGASDSDRLAAAASGFVPLPSRLRPIATVGGVTFVDDSLSTNVLPTLAALDVFPGRRLALLAGGHDRGIDYRPLASRLATRGAPTLLVALPDSGARLASLVRPAPFLEVRPVDDLAAGVALAATWAAPDGVVLLSPAAASFGRYRDYRDRSEAFAAAVAALAALPD